MKNLTILPLTVGLLGIPPVFGQAAPQASEIATVVVSASRSQTRIEDMPLHTTIVTREQIESSPAQSIDQLLRNVAGMNFTAVPAASSDPTGHQTRMRGLGNAKVLVLLDGVPIHDPFYLTTQWFKVPLSGVERIEVIRGGNSSLWGNMAVAGVVNIVSRRVRDNAGEVMASVGRFGSADVAVSKNVKLSDALGLNVLADVYHTDGYQTTPGQFLYRFPQKLPVRAENRNIQLRTDFRPVAGAERLCPRRLSRAGPGHQLPLRQKLAKESGLRRPA
jgi:iron complex outermembrane receptor protein